MKNHMTRRVARAVSHRERAVPDGDRVGVLQPARRRERLGRGQAEHLALRGQTVNPELVGQMRADDGQHELAREFGGGAGVVDMGMGEPDLRQRQRAALDFGHDQGEIAPGIDDGRLPGLVAPDQGAVLLERSHRNQRVLQHGNERL